jgi:hypothetical protein
VCAAPRSTPDPGQDRTLAPDAEERHSPGERLPAGNFDRQIVALVEHYNHRRYRERLDNVTPTDAHFGRADAIVKQHEKIKRQTIQYRRLRHGKLAA